MYCLKVKLHISLRNRKSGFVYESNQEKFMALIEISISLLCVISALLIDSCCDYNCELLCANDGNQVIER